MNTCTCNCLCVLVCVFAWRSEWLPVICLWGSPSWFPTQEFPTDPEACCFSESPAYPCHHLKLQPTMGSSCVGVEVSGSWGLHNKYWLAEPHPWSSLLFYGEMGNSLHCLGWPWIYTVTQARFELTSFCVSACSLVRILGLVNVCFLPLKIWGGGGCSMYVVLYFKWSLLCAGHAPKVMGEKWGFPVC